MWVINILHWLNEDKTGPAVPQLKLKVSKITEIITWVTSDLMDIPVGPPPKCWRRPGRKPCTGLLNVFLNPDTGQIVWFCNECGDEGAISGWEGLIWDMTDKDMNENVH